MSHIGNNVARLRGLFQIPQKQLAAKLDMSQQDYSKLEQKPVIEDDLLERIAAVFEIPVKLFKTLDEQFIQMVHQHEGNNGTGFDHRKADAELYERIIEEKNEVIRAKEEVIRMKDEMIGSLKGLLGK